MITYMLCALVGLIIQEYIIRQKMQGANNFKIFTVEQATVEL